jgi:hypothetical protein
VTKKYDPASLRSSGGSPPTAKLPDVFVRLIGANPLASHEEPAAGRLSTLPFVRDIPLAACGGPNDLTKYHYETWEVDLAKYPKKNLADVAFVELRITTDVGQPVYVDTLSLVKRP